MSKRNSLVVTVPVVGAIVSIAIALTIVAATANTTYRAGYLIVVIIGMIVACRPGRENSPGSLHASLVNAVTSALIAAACGLAVGLVAIVGGSVAVAALNIVLSIAGVTVLRAARHTSGANSRPGSLVTESAASAGADSGSTGLVGRVVALPESAPSRSPSH